MNDCKRHLADLAQRRACGQIGRRRFLCDAALLGLAAGGLARRPFRFAAEAPAAGEAERP